MSRLRFTRNPGDQIDVQTAILTSSRRQAQLARLPTVDRHILPLGGALEIKLFDVLGVATRLNVGVDSSGHRQIGGLGGVGEADQIEILDASLRLKGITVYIHVAVRRKPSLRQAYLGAIESHALPILAASSAVCPP